MARSSRPRAIDPFAIALPGSTAPGFRDDNDNNERENRMTISIRARRPIPPHSHTSGTPPGTPLA